MFRNLARRLRRSRQNEEGAAAIEYVMLLGFITAMILFLYSLLYPNGSDDIESLVNAWGKKMAEEIAGDRISSQTEEAYGTD